MNGCQFSQTESYQRDRTVARSIQCLWCRNYSFGTWVYCTQEVSACPHQPCCRCCREAVIFDSLSHCFCFWQVSPLCPFRWAYNAPETLYRCGCEQSCRIVHSVSCAGDVRAVLYLVGYHWQLWGRVTSSNWHRLCKTFCLSTAISWRLHCKWAASNIAVWIGIREYQRAIEQYVHMRKHVK